MLLIISERRYHSESRHGHSESHPGHSDSEHGHSESQHGYSESQHGYYSYDRGDTSPPATRPSSQSRATSGYQQVDLTVDEDDYMCMYLVLISLFNHDRSLHTS